MCISRMRHWDITDDPEASEVVATDPRAERELLSEGVSLAGFFSVEVVGGDRTYRYAVFSAPEGDAFAMVDQYPEGVPVTLLISALSDGTIVETAGAAHFPRQAIPGGGLHHRAEPHLDLKPHLDDHRTFVRDLSERRGAPVCRHEDLDLLCRVFDRVNRAHRLRAFWMTLPLLCGVAGIGLLGAAIFDVEPLADPRVALPGILAFMGLGWLGLRSLGNLPLFGPRPSFAPWAKG